MKTANKNKQNDLFGLAVKIAIIVLVNFIATFAFFRLDLTSEKRYSLTSSTKTLLEDLEDQVYVKVYLEGDFPAGFKNLRDESRQMLDEFKAYAGENVEYEFINPSESEDEKIRSALYKSLYEKGLTPTDLSEQSEDGYSKKIVWPGAIVSYKGKEKAVQLLKSQIMGVAPEEMLTKSIEGLEFEFADAIRKLATDKPKSIAFIDGHKELLPIEVADVTKALEENYIVKRVFIDERLNTLLERSYGRDSTQSITKNRYDLIVIARPRAKFSEKDKFIIDQHIMHGGKSLWLVDPIFASMDSLMTSEVSLAINIDLNLEDQLFKYGVRVNYDLIQDLQAAPIPLKVGSMGNQPRFEYFPWYFFPLMLPANNHPIVNNIDMVKGEFTSTLDTVGSRSINKTILLTSSQYTKVSNTPCRISFNMLRFEPDPNQFNKKFIPTAVLLEGSFESTFKNRLTPEFVSISEIGFKEKSEPTKMIVVGDGEVIKNPVNPRDYQYYPLGYDQYTKRTYGNKDFVMNSINYLLSEEGETDARSRTLKTRRLDIPRIKKEQLKWQLINMLTPVLLVALMGFFIAYYRKKKYAK